MSKILAFYLPQYHPTPENDSWWGKGFTEWTNVGKAKPLFKGHYQPHVPADLGYYDLRLPDVRSKQAEMAKKYGVDGFCYWHYWFGKGKQLLDLPFKEVVEKKEPNFPFCLGWANHSWMAKTWSKESKDRLLIEQTYPGVEDYKQHFESLITAFKDERYIKIDNKPLFVIWEPEAIPDLDVFFTTWKKMAKEVGFDNIHFMGFTFHKDRIDEITKIGFDSVIYDPIMETFKKSHGIKQFYHNVLRTLFSIPRRIRYSSYMYRNIKIFQEKDIVPCVLPNFDHTPRSGKRGYVLLSTPEKFKKHLIKIFTINKNKKKPSDFIFIKSWNEWGEGNYLEPDLKYKHKYLEALKEAVESDR